MLKGQGVPLLIFSGVCVLSRSIAIQRPKILRLFFLFLVLSLESFVVPLSWSAFESEKPTTGTWERKRVIEGPGGAGARSIRVRIGTVKNGSSAFGHLVQCSVPTLLKSDLLQVWRGRYFPGEIWFLPSAAPDKPGRQGQCEVVNVVELETYLAGVLNAEFSARWSRAAVDAQVIISRSYARRRAWERRRYSWDVESGVADQVYDGFELQKHDVDSPRLRVTAAMADSMRAVQRTKGQVLVLSGDPMAIPIRALFHSTCGGKTSNPEQVWGRRERGIRGVWCGACGSSPKANWDLELSESEIQRGLGLGRGSQKAGQKSLTSSVTGNALTELPGDLAESPSRDLAARQPEGAERVVDLRVEKRTREGRAERIVVDLRKQGASQVRQLAIAAADFRLRVGSTRLFSTWFEVVGQLIDPRDDQRHWRLRGMGYGHGLGMCQWGAKALGERGLSTAEILGRYYPDARLSKPGDGT